MSKGLSTNRLCDASAACLKSAGIDFVVRYYSRTTTAPEKVLRPKEASILAAAGIDLVVVYQDRARKEEDFGAVRGAMDGRSALEQAARVGQPPGSAIYFAVDVDFSRKQIERIVLPYFEGVKSAFDQSPSHFTLGVYGSGLTCRLVREALPFVKYSWLAESTGWRESDVYAGWHIKQSVNYGDSLCHIDSDWEACTARRSFGQFRPLGSSRQKTGETTWAVEAISLNLLSMPDDSAPPIVAAFPQGTLVEVQGEAGNDWVRVRWTLPVGDVCGYVRAAGLSPRTRETDLLSKLGVQDLPEVHLGTNNRSSARSTEKAREYPPGEPALPFRNVPASPDKKRQALVNLADWLDVEHSLRYLPNKFTYCNIYAADYCYLARAYLPRVWWTDKAIAAFARGERPPVAYGQTVREMRADDLHAWLLSYGEQFGWRRVVDLDMLQDTANRGGVGVICADRKAEGRSGHITVVVPETDGQTARRNASGNVLQPLQTQAGSRNRRYGSSGPDWWLGQQFRSFVMYVHE